MRARRVAGRSSRVLVAPLMLAAALAGLGPGAATAAAGCGTRAGQPVRPGSSSGLAGVTVASCTAWAVGSYTLSTGGRRTLIERWNGTAWKQQPSPSPGTSFNALGGAAATSPSDVWAVGQYSNDAGGATSHTLAEHWNGTTWARVPTPSPGGPAGYSQLAAVAATSASDAWAVGVYTSGPGTPVRGFAEHWNGTVWTLVPTPNPGGGTTTYNYLSAVAATSASNVWAVGWYSASAGGVFTLVEHWNGTTWTQVPSPSPGGLRHNNWLLGVTATSATDAWAVGRTFHRTPPYQYEPLIEHWNGTAWTQVPSPIPSPSIDARLVAVAATSASDALAVGYYAAGVGGFPDRTLAERWNGTAWTQVPSPNPSASDNFLGGVAAASPASFWAVGGYANNSQAQQALAFRCC
jgi:hypothetical protein